MSNNKPNQLIVLSSANRESCLTHRSLPITRHIHITAVLRKKTYLVDELGKIQILTNSNTFLYLKLPFKVKFIAACQTAALFISTDGATFAVGHDKTRSGVLGMPAGAKAKKPVLIEGLKGCRAVSCSISETHAGMIDEDGIVWTWGSNKYGQLGRQGCSDPTPLQQTGKQILCQDSYTCILTVEGCLIVSGALPTAHMSRCLPSFVNQPSRADLDIKHMNLESVQGGKGFIVLLTTDGIPFAVDGCHQLYQLPLPPGTQLISLTVSESVIYGLSANSVITWTQYSANSIYDKLSCSLSSILARQYRLRENVHKVYKILAGHNVVCIVSDSQCQSQNMLDESGVELSHREKHAQDLLQTLFNNMKSLCDTPKHPFNRITNLNKYEYKELVRLSALPRTLQNIENLLKSRIDYESRNKFLSAFCPSIYTPLKQIFQNIKQFGSLRIISRNTYIYSTMSNILTRVHQRLHTLDLGHSFLSIKDSTLSKKSSFNKSAKTLGFTLNSIFFRVLLESFSTLKDLELTFMQRNASVYSMQAIATHFDRKALKLRIKDWKLQTSEKKRKYTSISQLTHFLVQKGCAFSFEKVKFQSLLRSLKQDGARRLINLSLKFGYVTKYYFLVWKKSIESWKLQSSSYQHNINAKYLVLSLSSLVKQSQRIGFESLSLTGQRLKWKLGCHMMSLFLARKLKNSLYRWQTSTKMRKIGRRAFDTLKMAKILGKVFASYRKWYYRTIFTVLNKPHHPKQIGKTQMRAYEQRLIKNYANIIKTASKFAPMKPPWKPTSSSGLVANSAVENVDFKKKMSNSLRPMAGGKGLAFSTPQSKHSSRDFRFLRPKFS